MPEQLLAQTSPGEGGPGLCLGISPGCGRAEMGCSIAGYAAESPPASIRQCKKLSVCLRGFLFRKQREKDHQIFMADCS